MRQILQNLRNGSTRIADIPRPRVGAGAVLIRSSASLVSAGTERMLVEFGKAGWIDKARRQPDKVRMVIDKIRTDGLIPTVEAVMRKLDEPLPLGYCNVGTVVDVGKGVTAFKVGDRVASNGKHAEFVAVPVNLCAVVPDGVDDEAAAFTVAGAIALQGIRLANPTLGECVVVTGLGLIGLLTVQLLKAQGCRVLGIDLDAHKLELARHFGAETVELAVGADPVATAERFSRGRGVDAVIIAASTQSNEPVHQAARMCRKRGRIVLVGVAGLVLSRADFFEKELTFQVSCSYGPGRYDAEYEQKGNDYPVGFVRWTEQRNFEAVLDMMAEGHLDMASLISHRFAIEDAENAYSLIASDSPSLGVVLKYAHESKPESNNLPSTLRVAPKSKQGSIAVGFIGAGNYATSTLIPAFAKAGGRLKTVSSANGLSGTHAARKFGIELSSTDSASILIDPEIDVVVVATRHSSHARWVLDGLAAGKHVFVEKPLAIEAEDIDAIESCHRGMAQRGAVPRLMVGFNRRFAPQIQRMKELLDGAGGPKSVVMTVNAGSIPASHWTQDPEVGGGRIAGEACHFVDLLRFLVGVPIARHSISAMPTMSGEGKVPDTATIHLEYEDGSIGTVHYFANGHKAFPKERLEVFCEGRILQLDNFRRLTGYGWKNFRKMNLWKQDKGQDACAAAFLRSVREGGPSPISLDELLEVSRTTLALDRAWAVRDAS